jgi:hypothetical protein
LFNNKKNIDIIFEKIQELHIAHKNLVMGKITNVEYYDNLAPFLLDLISDIKNGKIFGSTNMESLSFHLANIKTLVSNLKKSSYLGKPQQKQEIEKDLAVSFFDIQKALSECIEFHNSILQSLDTQDYPQSTFNIFISTPSSLDEKQSIFKKMLEIILKHRGLIIKDVTPDEYPNEKPIIRVKKTMNVCSGAIILGFKQMIVKECIVKEGTPNEKFRENVLLPTPWNQIEAAIAITLEIPILIISEKGIEGGVFDPNITEQFVNQIELNIDSLDRKEFIDALNSWNNQITKKSK